MNLANTVGRKIIVIDDSDHPAYLNFKVWEIEDLYKWKTGNIRVILDDPEKAMTTINKVCSNAFVILEDSAKYLSGNISRPVKSFIIDHRKRNFDLLLMFHFLGDVPPYLAKMYNNMILFKTGDNMKVVQKKFANWHTISEKSLRINKHKNFNYCESVAIDE